LKARVFSYTRPKTISEAFEAFADAGGNASYIAGGQSLVPALALRLQAPSALVDIAHIPELRGIEMQGVWLRIGALTKHCEALTDPLIAQYAPLYRAAAPYVAHPAIRNKGTLGGSISHADPASEFPAVTLAMAAELEIANRHGFRRVPADEFFLDLFETAIKPGELLTALYIPVVGPAHHWAFDEFARRRGDFALVGAGIMATITDRLIKSIRIAFLSVGSTPVRARHTERVLICHSLERDLISAAQNALCQDLAPPDDEQLPSRVRLHLARVLLGRLLVRIADGI
jgi:aerobic carbon-monoxide dehydrogenase medium subunit